MARFLRPPTRDANDADHLAIILLIGGVLSFYVKLRPGELPYAWQALGVVSLIAAPLLWLRVPHAKWVCVLAAGIWCAISVLRVVHEPTIVRHTFPLLGSLLFIYWFIRIDYRSRFDGA